jgi:hypothetical protein
VNKFIIRTTNIAELEKFATVKVQYKSPITDIVFVDTTLSRKRLLKITGVYTVENDDVLGTLCS